MHTCPSDLDHRARALSAAAPCLAAFHLPLRFPSRVARRQQARSQHESVPVAKSKVTSAKRGIEETGGMVNEGDERWRAYMAGGVAAAPASVAAAHPAALYDSTTLQTSFGGGLYAGSGCAAQHLPISGAGPSAPGQQQQMQSPSSTSDGSAGAMANHTKPVSLSGVQMGPVEHPRSLNDIAPRQTFLSVIALYFHHLYPLLPMVHRPTFSHDLVSRRDEVDEDFLAFVLSLTAYTLVQAPRSVVPAPWPYFRRLHRLCHLTSRRMQQRKYDPAKIIHLCTLYCDHVSARNGKGFGTWSLIVQPHLFHRSISAAQASTTPQMQS